MEANAPRNIVVVDLETQHSADECMHCGATIPDRPPVNCGVAVSLRRHEKIGWDNKLALGLSIGCYYDVAAQTFGFFDLHTLVERMQHWCLMRPLFVSFNGIQFDFPLMRALVWFEACGELLPRDREALCDDFKALWAGSYDILAEIWKADPAGKFQRGNSLDAVSQANGLGAKLSHGAQAPRDWQAGKIAQVVNYCMSDVILTWKLFQMIQRGEPLKRPEKPGLLLPRVEGVCDVDA